MTLRFGILGTARIARRIVADMQSIDAINVPAIASRDRNRATWYGSQFGIPDAYGSYQELLDSSDIDAVYIPLPPSLHVHWAQQAARAGKHILVEKPVATNLESLRQLQQTCREYGVKWLDATAWLHHERTQRIQQIMEQGVLGRITHLSVACSFFEPFQSEDHRLQSDLGGGCLLDLGWYAFGFARWAGGSDPTVTAASGRARNGIEFRVNGMLQFPGDITAMVNCGYDTSSRKWFEIAGEDASLVCDDFTRPWTDRPGRIWIHDRAGGVQTETFEGNQEVRMLETFAKAITDGGSISSFNQQAMATQKLCEQVQSAMNAQIHE